MKDAVATMGGILPADAGGRDAVHVAVFSAIAPIILFPCQHVSVVHPEPNEHGDVVVSGAEGVAPRVGIVDPFLSSPVPAGERFWVYLYPRTITALSHRWSHPAFESSTTTYENPARKLASEQWLQDFCKNADCPGYHAVMGMAEKIANGGSGSDWDDECMHFSGSDAHGDIPDEFWDHVAIVLGREIKGPKAKYFSCSC